MNFKKILEKNEIRCSVPCRIDFGGTLDISTFYLPLNHLGPSTVNIALDMRTHVTLSPGSEGFVKVSSKGFESARFPSSLAPFNHPMGLMFAVASFFNAHGVHIQIESSSPPRSALGGSSSAAVAIISAFLHAQNKQIDPGTVALIAHTIESSVAGVPCGLQDQLAAAFGGVNQWFWGMGKHGPAFTQKTIPVNKSEFENLNQNIIVAYCGKPHISKNINKRWVNQFLSGKNRDKWNRVAVLTEKFADAVRSNHYALAGDLMNQETQIRLDMTPDVLDKTGKKLFEKAKEMKNGARFTGAGGGGCVWAIGRAAAIIELKKEWENLLLNEDEAVLLDTAIDNEGIKIN